MSTCNSHFSVTGCSKKNIHATVCIVWIVSTQTAALWPYTHPTITHLLATQYAHMLLYDQQHMFKHLARRCKTGRTRCLRSRTHETGPPIFTTNNAHANSSTFTTKLNTCGNRKRTRTQTERDLNRTWHERNVTQTGRCCQSGIFHARSGMFCVNLALTILIWHIKFFYNLSGIIFRSNLAFVGIFYEVKSARFW